MDQKCRNFIPKYLAPLAALVYSIKAWLTDNSHHHTTKTGTRTTVGLTSLLIMSNVGLSPCFKAPFSCRQLLRALLLIMLSKEATLRPVKPPYTEAKQGRELEYRTLIAMNQFYCLTWSLLTSLTLRYTVHPIVQTCYSQQRLSASHANAIVFLAAGSNGPTTVLHRPNNVRPSSITVSARVRPHFPAKDEEIKEKG
jgi:hypothetical protein